MYSYRISKFDPAADESGRRDNWTSISDIGREFSGIVLTRQMFEEMESRYVHALRLILDTAHVGALHVTEVVRPTPATALNSWVVEGMTVDAEAALEICGAQFREELSCHLEADTGFSIDFGFEPYVYVTSPEPLDAALSAIVESGLYVETGIRSPYYNE